MCSRWNELQQEAREAETGLWAEDEPIEPWEWRSWGDKCPDTRGHRTFANGWQLVSHGKGSIPDGNH